MISNVYCKIKEVTESFEIKGNVVHEGGGAPVPNTTLVQSMGKFQLVFEAEASASLFPDISYSGDLVLIHKERIGIFCFDKNTPK